MKAPNVLAVVVRYKLPIASSQTLAGLSAALQNEDLARNLAVLLWDNSPEPLVDPQLPFAFEYGWSEKNLGTAGAYNRAIAHARERGIPWLLLLDQDTDLTADFLSGMLRHARELSMDAEVGSVVPVVLSNGRPISPSRFQRFNRSAVLEAGFHGKLRDRAYALNSGSLMRVSALEEIGSYSEDFWLDLSDVYAFEQLHARGKTIFVAGDVHLHHSLSSMNFEEEMTPHHYESFLAAESAYLQMFRDPLENAALTLSLPLRALRQYMRYRNKVFARLTWRYFVMRVSMGRKKRLDKWLDFLRNVRGGRPATRQQ